MRELAHLTVRSPELTPADVDTVLSHLAETIAALPQVAGQLGGILDRSRQTHLLAMDGMTGTTDPDLAIDTARHHLDQTRHPAVETYRHLNAARNEVAHISATDLVDESWGGYAPFGDRRHRHEDRKPPRRGLTRDRGRSAPER